jgi:TPR repeat protein
MEVKFEAVLSFCKKGDASALLEGKYTLAEAQNELGYAYEHGFGVTADNKEAVKWYTRSAEAGNATAQFNIGCCYSVGTGVEKDDKEAFKWYTLAAEAGHTAAQHNLGFCYKNGEGVAKDAAKAIR